MTTNSTVKDPDHTYHTETNPIPHTSHADKCPDHRTKTKITHKDPGHAQHTETKTQNTQRQRPRPHTTHRTQITHITQRQRPHTSHIDKDPDHTHYTQTHNTHTAYLSGGREKRWCLWHGLQNTVPVVPAPFLVFLGYRI